ncbi:MAG: FecR family protein, partial [Anaerolineales bacterium]
ATKTGDEARVRVDISDGTIVRVGPNSEFRLVELSAEADDPVTRFFLDAGKMWVWVSKALGEGSFEIETPTGAATVRGSLMSVAYDQTSGRLIVTCLEGECRLADQAGQLILDLRAGEKSEIPGPGQGPLAAQLMDMADLADWAQNFPEALAIVDALRQRLRDQGTPTPPAPGGSGASGSAGQTACDHPYFPLRPGATWTYSTESGPLTWTVTGVTGDTTSATAEMDWTIGQVQGQYTWLCDTTGIVSYQFGSLSSSELGQFAVMNVNSHSGTWLPPAELLVPGYSWSNNYELQMQITLPEQSQQLTGINTNTEQYTVDSADPVSVGDQTVDGLQIARTGTQSTQVQLPGVKVPPTTFEVIGTFELGRGIGIVRMISRFEGQASTTELVSYSLP